MSSKVMQMRKPKTAHEAVARLRKLAVEQSNDGLSWIADFVSEQEEQLKTAKKSSNYYLGMLREEGIL